MLRSNQKKRSKSSQGKANKKRFHMESMEARRLMTGDTSLAGDVDAVEQVRPAIVAEADTPMPQTREHILLGRQVGIPATSDNEGSESERKFVPSNGTTVGTATDIQAPQDESETVRGANPMDLKRGIDETAVGDHEGRFVASNGTTVGTATDVLAPQEEGEPDTGSVPDDKLYDPSRDKTVDPADPGTEAPTNDRDKGRFDSPDDVLAPEREGAEDGGGDEGDLCSSTGVVVDTPCDVLGPDVDPDAAADDDLPGSGPYGSPGDVLAPDLDGVEDGGESDLCSSPGVVVDTPCDVLGPDVDPDNANAPSIPGDTNGDGIVDFEDFLTLSANYGKEVRDGYEAGDFNGDDVVDFNDFLQLSANYGTEAVDAVFASMAGD